MSSLSDGMDVDIEVRRRDNRYVLIAHQFGVVVRSKELKSGIEELERRVAIIGDDLREAGIPMLLGCPNGIEERNAAFRPFDVPPDHRRYRRSHIGDACLSRNSADRRCLGKRSKRDIRAAAYRSRKQYRSCWASSASTSSSSSVRRWTKSPATKRGIENSHSQDCPGGRLDHRGRERQHAPLPAAAAEQYKTVSGGGPWE